VCMSVSVCGVVLTGPVQVPSNNPLLAVRYRPVAGRDERCLPHMLCNIVVMEYLDR
jgi:hypothetical protein